MYAISCCVECKKKRKRLLYDIATYCNERCFLSLAVYLRCWRAITAQIWACVPLTTTHAPHAYL